MRGSGGLAVRCGPSRESHRAWVRAEVASTVPISSCESLTMYIDYISTWVKKQLEASKQSEMFRSKVRVSLLGSLEV